MHAFAEQSALFLEFGKIKQSKIFLKKQESTGNFSEPVLPVNKLLNNLTSFIKPIGLPCHIKIKSILTANAYSVTIRRVVQGKLLIQ